MRTSTVTELRKGIATLNRTAEEMDLKGGGGPPYDGDMETRIAILEAQIKTLSTKEDVARLDASMHKEIGAQTWRLVTFVCGFGAALVAATFFIAKHVG